MTRKLFTLLLLAGTVILSAQEVKLMFGAQKTPVRKEQSKFLDFRYVSQHDPMFTAAPKKLQGWNYNPAGGAAFSSFSAGTLPADILLEHGIACRSGWHTSGWATKQLPLALCLCRYYGSMSDITCCSFTQESRAFRLN